MRKVPKLVMKCFEDPAQCLHKVTPYITMVYFSKLRNWLWHSTIKQRSRFYLDFIWFPLMILFCCRISSKIPHHFQLSGQSNFVWLVMFSPSFLVISLQSQVQENILVLYLTNNFSFKCEDIPLLSHCIQYYKCWSCWTCDYLVYATHTVFLSKHHRKL